MLSVRVADVFDANVMGRIACVKGRECDWWGMFVFDDIVDEPFIGDDCCQLEKAYEFLYLSNGSMQLDYILA
jgi:hypothetical protein